MRLSGRAALVEALQAVGERLAYDGATCTLVVVGGAALNLLGIVDRPTIDVDVLARVGDDGGKRCNRRTRSLTRCAAPSSPWPATAASSRTG